MLIDLERNDLGRVCVGGSVRVDEYMSVETYAHVHHIVSNVSGRLRNDVSPVGRDPRAVSRRHHHRLPEVRCMEIIAELEGVGPRRLYRIHRLPEPRRQLRSQYPDSHHHRAGGHAFKFRAGAGIVADSIPEQELAETRAKAEGLLRALEGSSREHPGSMAANRHDDRLPRPRPAVRRRCFRDHARAAADGSGCWNIISSGCCLGCRRCGSTARAGHRLRRELVRSRRPARREGVLKLIVTRGRGPRGYRPTGRERCTRILSLHSLPKSAVVAERRAGRGCGCARRRSGRNPRLAGLKTLNRLESVLARAEWSDARIWEGLMQRRGREHRLRYDVEPVREAWIVSVTPAARSLRCGRRDAPLGFGSGARISACERSSAACTGRT